MVRVSMTIAVALCAAAAAAPAALAQVEKRDHRVRDRPAPAPPVVRSFAPDHGEVGTTVTIRGTFPDGTRVLFGRQEIRDAQQRRGTLTFTIPQTRPGRHAIVLAAPGGEVTVGDFTVSRVEPPPPPPPPPVTKGPPPVTKGPPPGPPPRRGHGKRFHRDTATVQSFWPREGPPGTSVTIRGERLSSELQLVFGEQIVKPARITGSALTFKVPRGEGESLIVLRQPGRRDLVVGRFEVTKSARAVRRDQRREEQRRLAEQQWLDSQKKLPKAKPDRHAALRAYEEQLAREREQRRAARIAAMRAQWERQFLAQGEVQAELSLHAERRARLARMLRLAEADDHGKLVIRIRVLIQAEDRRHEQRMADLRAAFAMR
jgi:hypothetical protein